MAQANSYPLKIKHGMEPLIYKLNGPALYCMQVVSGQVPLLGKANSVKVHSRVVYGLYWRAKIGWKRVHG